MPASNSFGIKETDDYVRKILSRAGQPPADASPDAVTAWLLPNVIWQESRGNPDAVSSKGALGRLQVMPATAANPGFGIEPAKDHSPEELERVGKSYLKAMVARYPGRPDLALAAYNAGPGRADKWTGVDVMQDIAEQSAAENGGQPLVFRGAAGFDRDALLVAPSLGELRTVDRSRESEGFSGYFQDIVGVDSSIAAYHNIAEDSGYEVDPDFDIAAIPSAEWDKLTAGIPEEFQEGLGNAVSKAHLQTLAARARATLEAEARLAEYGGWGLAGRFAYNMVGDPLSVAIGAATGGIGSLTKAARLAKAAKAATAAKKFEDATRAVEALGTLSRSGAWRNAGKAAFAAGAENAALESFLNQGNITRDGWDVAFAGLAGGALGAGFSRVFRGRELRDVQHAYLRAQEELKLAELSETIGQRQQAIDLKMKWLHADGDVAAAQRQLKELQVRQQSDLQLHQKTLDANRAARQDYLNKLSAKRRKELEPVIERGRNAENMRSQLDSRLGKARQEVEELQERIEGGDRSQATLSKMTDANRRMREAQKLYDNHVARTAKQVEAAERAEAELASRGIPTAAADGAAMASFASRQARELVEARGRLRAAQDAVEARRVQLEADQAALDQMRIAGVDAVDKITSQHVQAFGQDSGGAARFNGFYEEVHPEFADDSGLPSSNPVAQMGSSLGGARSKLTDLLQFRRGPFATFSMILRGAPSDTVRNELGRIVGNSIGTKDGSANTVGASEIAHVLRQRYEAKFNTVVTPTYAAWRKKQGIGMVGANTRKVRDQFMTDVGKAVRGDESMTDPDVLKAASGMRRIFNDYLREAKEAGVKGFENVDPREDYLPRVFDFHRLHVIEHQIGTPNLRVLVAGAIRSSDDEISEKIAGRIAKAYVSRMKKLRVGADIGLIQGMKWDDVGFLRQFLKDADLASDEIEEVIGEFAALNARRQRQTEGSFRNAKKRVQMDENFRLTFKDQEALRRGEDKDVTVTVSDLFENNVEALFGRYNRTVAGHIGLAKVGIRSKQDFEDSIKRVQNELEHDSDELERVESTARAAYALVTGTPIEDATGLTRLGRAVRDWNFTTTMGQSGWAQLPDLAGLLQKGYLGHTIKHFPEIFGTVRRKNGSIDIEFYRELEEWSGLGTDLFNNRIFSSFDWGDEGEGLGRGLLGKAEHGVRVAGRGVQKASGLSFMTEMSQRMAGRVIIQRLVDDVLGSGNMAEHRALALGLDGPMKARIAQQLKDHTQFADGQFGGKVRLVNYAGWKDTEARDAFLYAVSKEARRIVQEEDLGDTTLWMHKNWGKILGQFRRFALVSYSRQILYGIAHADAEEATRVIISMALAAAAFKARHETNLALKQAGGMSDEDAEKYREKYLTTDRLAAAAWANSSYSSFLPGLWDTGQVLTTGTRTFDTRTSGQPSDIITGNPTYRLGTNLMRAVGGSAQAIVRGDKQFDQTDAEAWRRLMPFQNVLGMDLPWAAINSNLPERDDDPDPEEIDWLLNDQPQ